MIDTYHMDLNFANFCYSDTFLVTDNKQDIMLTDLINLEYVIYIPKFYIYYNITG